MKSLTHENLLVSVLRGESPPASIIDAIDTASFVDLCRRHRVSGLIYEQVCNSRGLWPPDLSVSLKTAAHKTLVDNLVLVKALKETAAVLKSIETPFILLKGASLLGDLYPQLQMRAMSDLDLLIRHRDWPRVAESLANLGYHLPSPAQEKFYRETWYHQLVKTAGFPSCYLEFHWNLESEERSRIEPEALFEQAIPCKIQDEEFQRLCDDHLFLHLAVHLAHHYQSPSLHWVEDLRRLVSRESLDWDLIASLACRWRVENCLAYSLGYLHRVYPGTVPEEARRFRFSGLRKTIVDRFRTPDPTLPHCRVEQRPLRHALSMALLDRWRDVGRYVLVHSFQRILRRTRREGES